MQSYRPNELYTDISECLGDRYTVPELSRLLVWLDTAGPGMPCVVAMINKRGITSGSYVKPCNRLSDAARTQICAHGRTPTA
jgi:hypothetical protein